MNQPFPATHELDLKNLVKKIYCKIEQKKRRNYIYLALIMMLAGVYFAKINYLPNYQASLIIKSKFIKEDQLNKNLDLYNFSFQNPDLNPIDGNIFKALDELGVTKIKAEELKNNEDILKNNEENKIKIYTLEYSFKKRVQYVKLIEYNKIILNDLQLKLASDNQLVTNKVRLNNSILELDSLIKVAYSAGIGYTAKINSESNGQLMIMNDIYNGINNLVIQKLGFTQDLSMLQSENIIYQASPIVQSNSVKLPWAVFPIAFVLWLVIIFSFTLLEIIFRDSE